jgi:hypothetical protein
VQEMVQIIVNGIGVDNDRDEPIMANISKWLTEDLERLGIDIEIGIEGWNDWSGGYIVRFKNEEDLHMALLLGIIEPRNYLHNSMKTYIYIRK